MVAFVCRGFDDDGFRFSVCLLLEGRERRTYRETELLFTEDILLFSEQYVVSLIKQFNARANEIFTIEI